ncbi:MAG TPA: hypothetical protein VEL07_20670 [Planctomycetota bacterium]|nr:hypothetical protein [Planctomycetota bacterium]
MRTLLLACTCFALAAGEVPAPTGAGGGADQALRDAAEIFERQAGVAVVPSGAAPGIVGAYIWSGRADQEYKPFFQWELRVRAGSEAANQVACRLTTLGPMREKLVEGHEQTIGGIAAGAAKDCSYKLNCTNFTAYQIDLAWNGGKQSYLAWDKVTLPIAIAASTGSSFLVTVNQNAERDAKNAKGPVTVTWNLWNIGGAEAKGVVQTVHFLDRDGKEVHKAEYIPDKGLVPGDSAKEHKTVLKGVPAFATISITTRQPDSQTLDPGAFTGAKDVEVAQVRHENNRLKARVRNGTDADIVGLVIAVTFVDANAKDLRVIDVPVGSLARGAERDIAVEVAKLPTGWASYTVGWKTADGQHSTTTGQTIEVHGVAVTFDQRIMVGTRLKLSGTLTNTRDKELVNIDLTFHLTHKGRKEDLRISYPRIGKGQSVPIMLEPDELTDYDAVSLEWKAK